MPNAFSEGFIEEVRELRERSLELPDDYLVCLVGDMITEEALLTYQTMLNTLDGVRDETGASPTTWARWSCPRKIDTVIFLISIFTCVAEWT